MSYLIIAEWDENNKPTKTNIKKSEAEALAWISENSALYPNSFFVSAPNTNLMDFITVDPINEAVIYDQVKDQESILLSHVSSYREQKIAEGTTVNGVVIEGDLTTQVRLAGARIEAEADANYTVDWKAVNGKVTLTAAQVIGLSSAFRAHTQKCFDAYFSVAENIGNYSTTEQVEQAFDTAYAAL